MRGDHQLLEVHLKALPGCPTEIRFV
jgi:hypothetical protein